MTPEKLDNLLLRTKLRTLLQEAADATPKELARDLARLAYEADSSSAVITLQEQEREKALTNFNQK